MGMCDFLDVKPGEWSLSLKKNIKNVGIADQHKPYGNKVGMIA